MGTLRSHSRSQPRRLRGTGIGWGQEFERLDSRSHWAPALVCGGPHAASIRQVTNTSSFNLDRSVSYRRFWVMHLLAREEAGLRCLLQVALSELAESLPAPLPIAQIAAAEGLSDVYAAKLMRQLRLAGLVESTRGANGGYRLSRAAESITVWDTIRALDESFLPGAAACDCGPQDRADCRRTTSCAVNSLWRRIGTDLRDSLESVSLADLCAGSLDRTDHVSLPTLQAASPAN